VPHVQPQEDISPEHNGEASMTSTHTPDPAPEHGAFDVCERCGQAIVEHWATRAWVTMTGGNAECYGRRT